MDCRRRGKDYGTVDISERTLEEIYLPPFKAAVEAGVATFMPAFNDIAGVPCTANKWLLTEVLRNRWKFKGVVVSDWGSYMAVGATWNGSRFQASRRTINQCRSRYGYGRRGNITGTL